MNDNAPYRLFMNSLKLVFLHITPYRFDYTWQIRSRRITHSVLWYLEAGEIRFSVNGVNYEANQGELIFLPPQSVISAHAVSSQIGIVSINFSAELSLVQGRIWSDIIHLPIVNPAYDRRTLEPVIRTLLEEAQEPSFAQSLLLQSSLLRLLGLMFKQSSPSRHAQIVSYLDPRVLAVIEYISLQPQSTPVLAELCELFHVSESYLRKLFTDYTGMSPLAFIHQYKIEQAQKQLLSGTERIAEIAYGLGFKDANYFSRLFKKKTGCTPNDYRQKLRNWMSDAHDV